MKPDGTVVCWGSNSSGQSNVPLSLGATTQVTAGGSHTVVLTLGGSSACPADFNHDGQVDGADLGFMLASWGMHQADLTGNGAVDGADIGCLLGAWGPCPLSWGACYE
jgi:hypothetical protein